MISRACGNPANGSSKPLKCFQKIEADNIFKKLMLILATKQGLIFHVNHLSADRSHKMSSLIPQESIFVIC